MPQAAVVLTYLLTSGTNMDFALPPMAIFLFLGCVTEKHIFLDLTSKQKTQDSYSLQNNNNNNNKVIVLCRNTFGTSLIAINCLSISMQLFIVYYGSPLVINIAKTILPGVHKKDKTFNNNLKNSIQHYTLVNKIIFIRDGWWGKLQETVKSKDIKTSPAGKILITHYLVQRWMMALQFLVKQLACVWKLWELRTADCPLQFCQRVF